LRSSSNLTNYKQHRCMARTHEKLQETWQNWKRHVLKKARKITVKKVLEKHVSLVRKDKRKPKWV